MVCVSPVKVRLRKIRPYFTKSKEFSRFYTHIKSLWRQNIKLKRLWWLLAAHSYPIKLLSQEKNQHFPKEMSIKWFQETQYKFVISVSKVQNKGNVLFSGQNERLKHEIWCWGNFKSWQKEMPGHISPQHKFFCPFQMWTYFLFHMGTHLSF